MCVVGVRRTLHEVRETLRWLCPEADVVAYVDDLYLVVSVDVIDVALRTFADVKGRMGLRAHPATTKIWVPTLSPSVLPPEPRAHHAASLKAVGTPLLYAWASARPDDAAADDNIHLHIEAELVRVTPEAFARRHEACVERLVALQRRGSADGTSAAATAHLEARMPTS